jgi:hypothetical protein
VHLVGFCYGNVRITMHGPLNVKFMIKILCSVVDRRHLEFKSQTDGVGVNPRVSSYVKLQ